jgi:hypothetical protein
LAHQYIEHRCEHQTEQRNAQHSGEHRGAQRLDSELERALVDGEQKFALAYDAAVPEIHVVDIA